MNISGWGNNLIIQSKVYYPKNITEIVNLLKEKKHESILPRGEGRSYGDVALNKNILSLNKFKKIISLNKKKGILKCTANVTIEEILPRIVPKGWFLSVTPGSKFVSIGGLVANDVHGKNHHVDGSFSDFVQEIKIIDQFGKIKICSKKKNISLFKTTCGGVGLTGVIIEAKIKLIKIKSKNIDVKIHKTKNLKETINLFKKIDHHKYTVGWVDTCSNKKFGRSLIYCGEHSNDNQLDYRPPNKFTIPSFLIKFFMNRFFISIFNMIYFYKSTDKEIKKDNINNFFYPLDIISNWNKFYGKDGFTQIQILIKDRKKYYSSTKKIFNLLDKYKIYSFLTTIKIYGKGNNNFLSFCEKGMTITMDVPISKSFRLNYLNLEKLFLKQNIKIYLAKDSFMSAKHFSSTYRNLNNFTNNLKLYNSNSIFKSKLSDRLKIT